jgi:hypothetical protein
MNFGNFVASELKKIHSLFIEILVTGPKVPKFFPSEISDPFPRFVVAFFKGGAATFLWSRRYCEQGWS